MLSVLRLLILYIFKNIQYSITQRKKETFPEIRSENSGLTS